MASNFFCVDIGESQIKIVDIKVEGGLFNANILGLMPIDKLFYHADAENIVEKQSAELAKTIAKLGIGKKNVNIIVPDSVSYNQIIETPKLNEKELLLSIKYQADQFIPMPLDDTNLDVEILQEDIVNKKILTLMSACPKKTVSKVQTLVETSGLIPESIETEISAVGRFLSQTYKPQPNQNERSGIILLNLGLSTTSLYFLEEHLGIISAIHNFNIGHSLFLKEVGINLNLDEQKSIEILKNFDSPTNTSVNVKAIVAPVAKNLIMEIQRFANRLKDQKVTTIKKILMFNEAARFPSLSRFIQETSQIPTSLVDLYPLFKKNNTVDFFKNELSLFLPAIGGNLR